MEKQVIIDSVQGGIADAVKSVSEKVTEDRLDTTKKSVGVLDAIQEKVISRKLLVFGTATALMWFGLDSQTWGMIAMCYIGGQSAIDFAKVWKGI